MFIAFSPSSSRIGLKKLSKYLTGIVMMQHLKLRYSLQHESWGDGLVLLMIEQHTQQYPPSSLRDQIKLLSLNLFGQER